MRPLRAAPHALITTEQLHDRRFTKKQIEAMVRWDWGAVPGVGLGSPRSPPSVPRSDPRQPAGFELIRFDAEQVFGDPAEVAATLLAARPALR